MSAFGKMVQKLEGKGYRAVAADKIAAKIGIDKYGKKGMAEKAAAARKR